MFKKLFRSTFILALIILLTFLFSREFSHLHFLTKENKKIEERIETLTIQNENYKEKIDSVKNDKRYIEKLIRDDLGMIKKGEKVYKFSN